MATHAGKWRDSSQCAAPGRKRLSRRGSLSSRHANEAQDTATHAWPVDSAVVAGTLKSDLVSKGLRMNFSPRTLAKVMLVALLSGCADVPSERAPVALVPHVDIPRFMGDWYVIANIPTFLEKGAHNAKDSYRLESDGTIPTTFSFNADAPHGPAKHYESRGFVLDTTTNAIWGQQYVWPFKADYRISYLSPDYTQTVITRDKRDYVWIMARTPSIPEGDLERLKAFVSSQGYDVSKLQRVPQDILRK
jgi:apolipoprotein D and lipocalin family protein